MGWFSDLFNRKPYGPDIAFNCNVPMPKVKYCKEEQSGLILPKGAVYTDPKDISEPVYSIVKAMQERPSSFKIKPIENSYDGMPSFDVTDIKTQQKVSAKRVYGFREYYFYTLSWEWLTKQESQLLGQAAEEIYNKKCERLKNIQRAAMKAIYK